MVDRHDTTDFWYKPKYIKKIRKENGKLRKGTQLHPTTKRFLILIEIQRLEVEVEHLHLPEMNKKDTEL